MCHWVFEKSYIISKIDTLIALRMSEGVKPPMVPNATGSEIRSRGSEWASEKQRTSTIPPLQINLKRSGCHYVIVFCLLATYVQNYGQILNVRCHLFWSSNVLTYIFAKNIVFIAIYCGKFHPDGHWILFYLHSRAHVLHNVTCGTNLIIYVFTTLYLWFADQWQLKDVS